MTGNIVRGGRSCCRTFCVRRPDVNDRCLLHSRAGAVIPISNYSGNRSWSPPNGGDVRMEWPIENLKRRAAPATDGAIAQFEYAFGHSLPRDYVDFLKTTNGGEGTIGAAYVRFWNVEELLEMNRGYNVQAQVPGLLAIGSDGGGGAFAFDTRQTPWTVVCIPFIVMLFEDAVPVGNSFTEFIQRLLRLGVMALSRRASAAIDTQAAAVGPPTAPAAMLAPSKANSMPIRDFNQPRGPERSIRSVILHRDTLMKSLDRRAART